MDGITQSLQARTVTSGVSSDALERLRSDSSSATPAEAAKKFEALFATLLVKEMRGSLSEGFFGSGPQADVYAGWLDQFVGESIAKDGGLHLADGLERSLTQKQDAERAARQAGLFDGSSMKTSANTTNVQEIQP